MPLFNSLTEEQKQLIEDALSDPRLIAASTYREQCFILCCLLHNTDNPDEKPAVSYDIIGKIFKEPKTHFAIIEQYDMSLKSQLPAYRPFFLTDEEIAAIEEEIKRKGDDYPTIDDISYFIMSRFGKYPSRSTIKRAVNERMNRYKIQRVKGIEDNRYDCKLDDIVNFYSELKREIEGVPVGFVFNLDESGQNTFIDALNLYVIVLKNKDVRSPF